jgi:hypothetical protein
LTKEQFILWLDMVSRLSDTASDFKKQLKSNGEFIKAKGWQAEANKAFVQYRESGQDVEGSVVEGPGTGQVLHMSGGPGSEGVNGGPLDRPDKDSDPLEGGECGPAMLAVQFNLFGPSG